MLQVPFGSGDAQERPSDAFFMSCVPVTPNRFRPVSFLLLCMKLSAEYSYISLSSLFGYITLCACASMKLLLNRTVLPPSFCCIIVCEWNSNEAGLMIVVCWSGADDCGVLKRGWWLWCCIGADDCGVVIRGADDCGVVLGLMIVVL